MKNTFFLVTVLLAVTSCGGSGEGGVINDGIQPVDPNGALVDSTKPWNPAIDSTRGESRVDIQQRGSTHVAPQPLKE